MNFSLSSPPFSHVYSQGSNLSGHAVAFVVAASTTVAILFTVLAILGATFMMSAAGAGMAVILIVFYFVGAAKLTAVLGDGNETGIRIITLTRQIAGLYLFNILVQISYVIVGGGNTLIPLQIIITNLLMPVGQSAVLLLILRFIRGSFTRQGDRIAKAASKKGTRSTASVAPATDFKSSTAGGESTATDVEVWGGTTENIDRSM